VMLQSQLNCLVDRNLLLRHRCSVIVSTGADAAACDFHHGQRRGER
jgi:hypothetical protein